jgi:polysaccharide biosynthesis protein PslG
MTMQNRSCLVHLKLHFALLSVSLLPACRAAPPGSLTPEAEPYTKPISFSILEDYDKGDDLAKVAKDFAAFRELGVTVWRGSWGWDDYEPEPGRYDFDWLERFVRLADSSGISLRPYLGYTPAWAARGGRDE